MKFKLLLCPLIATCYLSSCTNLGTMQLPSNRIRYNYSLENSDVQQRLLNIVRLRYNDAPYFLNVTSIVSQFTYSGNVTGLLSNNPAQVFGPATVWNAGGGAGMTETPTITYAPLQGKKYVTMLLTPIDLTVIYMMLREGWGISHIFRLLIQQFGSLENGSLATGVYATRIPHYKEFLRLCAVLQDVQYNDNLVIDDDEIDGKPAIKLTILHFNQLNAAQRATLAHVGFTANTPYTWLVSTPSKTKPSIYVQTRTVIGVFNYLSRGVEVPAEHIRLKQAPTTRLRNGQIINWRELVGGMINIRTSKYKPSNAAVILHYRQHWFYIADDDFISKETLDLLTIITSIYEGTVNTSAPVFTIN